MVQQIFHTPDIFSIPVPLPNSSLKILNSYVICSSEKNLIIDTGFNLDVCRKAFWAGIDELKIDLSKTMAVFTHLHPDHIGLVWDLIDKGIPIYMCKDEYDYMLYMDAQTKDHVSYKQFYAEGAPLSLIQLQDSQNHGIIYAPDYKFPANMLQDGEFLPFPDIRIQLIETPGHTPGNAVLYLPDQQILFSGDHILFDITPNIFLWPGMEDNFIASYGKSLLEIKKLPIKATFPAHRTAPVDVYTRIDQLIEHHNARFREIYDAVRAAPGSNAHDVAAHVSWSMHGKTWENAPANQKYFAMGEVIVHLHYLCKSGQLIQTTNADGFITYTLGSKPFQGWDLTPAN